MDLIDIYQTFHPKSTIQFLLKCSCNILQYTSYILGHKSSLGKFLNIEIVSSIFSSHNTMRLDNNYREKICKKYKDMEAKRYTTK